MADPVKERQSYIDQKVEEAEGIVDKANQSLQERDSKAAQDKDTEEKAGVGKDNSDENKKILLKDMEERAAAYEKLGKREKAAEVRARMKELEQT